jgi:hypothetical protein
VADALDLELAELLTLTLHQILKVLHEKKIAGINSD